MRDAAPPVGSAAKGQGCGATILGATIEKKLGSGPVCTSWLATRNSDRVVVRVLREPFVGNAKARAEWVRASWAANRFHHRRVVRVIDQGFDPWGAPVVVRGWANGETIEEALGRGGPLDPTFALRLVEQILDALEMAHAHGIVHGALTPSNVVLSRRGSVRLVDFAMTPALHVRTLEASEVLAAARVGPLSAPERRRSPRAPPSEQSDVWSVAACLYFAIVGEPPSESVELLARSHPQGDALAALVALALSDDPARRYESAYAMLGDVRRLLTGCKPKLDRAYAPVPSQSTAQSAALPPSSSGMRGVEAEGPPPLRGGVGEWRGNVLLIAAITLLVGLATFVMVRERLAESLEATPHSTTRP